MLARFVPQSDSDAAYSMATGSGRQAWAAIYISLQSAWNSAMREGVGATSGHPVSRPPALGSCLCICSNGRGFSDAQHIFEKLFP